MTANGGTLMGSRKLLLLQQGRFFHSLDKYLWASAFLTLYKYLTLEFTFWREELPQRAVRAGSEEDGRRQERAGEKTFLNYLYYK